MAASATKRILRGFESASISFRSMLCSGVDGMMGVAVDPSQTLIINGFWRSGTTWLQEVAAEMMDAKIVFEPSQVRAKAIFGCLDEIRPQRRDPAFINALMPYLQTLPATGKLRDLIYQSLRGQNRTTHVRRGLPGFRDSVRKKVVAKYTRGALCLVAISQAFHGPVIHIRRDPRAVISSIKKNGAPNWGEGAFVDFDLATHLLGVDDGRRDYFQRWEREIHQLQGQDDITKLAAYYCLTERCLIDQVAKADPSRFVVVQYEDLKAAGPENFRSLLEEIGVDTHPIAPERFYQQSSTAFSTRRKSRQVKDPSKCAAGNWRTLLSPAEQRSIEDTAQLFGMEDRLVET